LEIEVDESMEGGADMPSQAADAETDLMGITLLKASLGRPKRRLLVDSDDE
jgi:hypothetical protein